jgi:MoxR-like ATPase
MSNPHVEILDFGKKEKEFKHDERVLFVNDANRNFARRLRDGIKHFVYGQDEAIDMFLAGLFGMLNMSLVGESGCGKTYLVETTAELLGLKELDTGKKEISALNKNEQPENFRMIIGHPEIMPSDLRGKIIPKVDGDALKFYEAKGVLQANIVFVDEFNRIGPRPLSALLGPMNNAILVHDDGSEVRLGTEIGENQRRYYLVILSSNPVSRGGNYSPPDAILDRTGLQIKFSNLNPFAQKEIAKQTLSSPEKNLKTKRTAIKDLRQIVTQDGSVGHTKNEADQVIAFIAKIRDEIHKTELDNEIANQIEKFRCLLVKPKDYILQRDWSSNRRPSTADLEEMGEGIQTYIWEKIATGEKIDKKYLNNYIRKFIRDKNIRREIVVELYKLSDIVGNIEVGISGRIVEDIEIATKAMAFVQWAIGKDEKINFNEAFRKISENVIEHRIRFVQGVTPEEKRKTFRLALEYATCFKMIHDSVTRNASSLKPLKLFSAKMLQSLRRLFYHLKNLWRKIKTFFICMLEGLKKTCLPLKIRISMVILGLLIPEFILVLIRGIWMNEAVQKWPAIYFGLYLKFLPIAFISSIIFFSIDTYRKRLKNPSLIKQ